ncbi:MAG: isocitrate lyase/PEP mutase family protein [Thermoleophilia bacterium]|nr:isocitrate lyase/PEP mutase family protein [Thermoleophilia bacterium]
MSVKSSGAALSRLLSEQRPLVVPGVFSAMSARIFEKAGFEALYMTGFGVSASLLGMPDAGLITMSEMRDSARLIAQATRVPLIADADTGFGNAVNVTRTVREYIRASVAAIQLEDQVSPKRCGHVAGRRLIPLAEAQGKLRAAVDTRNACDPDCLIIARTDARGVSGGGLEHAIERGLAYEEAGADLVFLEGLETEDEIVIAAERVSAPLVYNVAGGSPRVSAQDLGQMGVSLVLVPVLPLAATMAALWEIAAALRDQGPIVGDDIDRRLSGSPLQNMFAFLGFPEIRQLEQRYLPPEEMDKYEGASGFRP